MSRNPAFKWLVCLLRGHRWSDLDWNGSIAGHRCRRCGLFKHDPDWARFR